MSSQLNIDNWSRLGDIRAMEFEVQRRIAAEQAVGHIATDQVIKDESQSPIILDVETSL